MCYFDPQKILNLLKWLRRIFSNCCRISSTSSYSSMESLNMRESNLEEALGKQTKSRRNLKGWLRKSRKAAVPVAQNHLRTTGSRTSRRAARLQGCVKMHYFMFWSAFSKNSLIVLYFSMDTWMLS